MTRHGRSGQILVVSALVIALIMISTATYIYNLSGSTSDNEQYLLNDYVNSIIQGSKHAMVSALANTTNRGINGTITTNLKSWSTAVERQYVFETFTLNYTLRNTAPYASGLYLNWSKNGNGVSAAYADFVLNASSRELKMQYPFYVNVSTRLQIEGYLTQVSPSKKQVTVICRLFNERQPALARNVTINYKDSDSWLASSVANDYALLDYGNGTYRATFTLANLATLLDVSVQVFDLRNIFVQANATLAQQ
jgi:hypothetical protein